MEQLILWLLLLLTITSIFAAWYSWMKKRYVIGSLALTVAILAIVEPLLH